MKLKPRNRWLTLLFLWALGVGLLWPYRDTLLPAARSASGDTPVVLPALSSTASLSLITEPEDGTQALTQKIEAATKSIDLVVYELEDPQVEQALADAHARGVAVRVMLENLHTFGNTPNEAAFEFLQSRGVSVIWSPSYFPLTHQKTLVVDGVEAFIMTFNLTPRYYTSSRDFAVDDTNHVDVSAIEATFGDDWAGRDTTTQNTGDLLWSPGASGTLLALIASASTTLDVYNEEMADPRIILALEQAAARGVMVRVDMTYETQWKSALGELVASGVEVRTYASSAKFYIHAKAIVVDGTEAFVGSQNFSGQSLDANRELGVLLARPDILASLEATFEKDWALSRPFASQ